jgi:hypothetical protein
LNNVSVAVCGLDCRACKVYQAATDKEIAQGFVDWFHREQGVDVQLEDVHCSTCRGDRQQHWSADCWILKCCVDDRGLRHCNECDAFPYVELREWAQGNAKYAEALDQLRAMNES